MRNPEPDIVQETTEKIRKIQEKFRTTQNRQKVITTRRSTTGSLTLESVSFYGLHRLRELARVLKTKKSMLRFSRTFMQCWKRLKSGLTDWYITSLVNLYNDCHVSQLQSIFMTQVM